MARSMILKFSPQASRDLREIASRLHITEEEVIRYETLGNL